MAVNESTASALSAAEAAVAEVFRRLHALEKRLDESEPRLRQHAADVAAFAEAVGRLAASMEKK